MSKKQNLFHPFLFSVYPIITLYSRLPGAIPAATLIRPILVAFFIPAVILFLGLFLKKDLGKIAIITSIAVIFFSTSGHTYMFITNRVWPTAPISLHLGIVILLISILIFFSNQMVWEKVTSIVPTSIQTKFFNIISVVAILFPIISIGKVWSASILTDIEPSSIFYNQNDSEQELNINNLPDIYYVILDGYGREDVLELVYGFSNDEFLNHLRDKGFYIAQNSRSNYIHSFLSIGSSLNFNYVKIPDEPGYKETGITYPFIDLILNNKARKDLKDIGYKIVALASDFPFTDMKNADIYLSPFKSNITELERYYLSTTSFELAFEADWFLGNYFREILPIPSYSTRQEYVLFALDQLEKSPALPSPKFVFSHIIIPHPPFVFDEIGKRLPSDGVFSPADGDAYQGSAVDYQSQYISQLVYINREMVKVIDGIISESAQTPIIIIQGDHGPGSLFTRDSLEDSCLYERSSILNAILLPNGYQGALYPEVSPVNTFRIVFNESFGTNYEILPDETYFSPISRPYDFINITEHIESNCE